MRTCEKYIAKKTLLLVFSILLGWICAVRTEKSCQANKLLCQDYRDTLDPEDFLYDFANDEVLAKTRPSQYEMAWRGKSTADYEDFHEADYERLADEYLDWDTIDILDGKEEDPEEANETPEQRARRMVEI